MSRLAVADLTTFWNLVGCLDAHQRVDLGRLSLILILILDDLQSDPAENRY